MENQNDTTGGPQNRDPVKDLQARIEAAIDEVRPKIRKAMDELDARMDEAIADIRPRAESAMEEVRPKVDQFVADVQPRLDSLLERLQVKINELRKDLDDRATRSSKPVTPAGELPAQGSTAPPASAPGDGPGDPGTLP